MVKYIINMYACYIEQLPFLVLCSDALYMRERERDFKFEKNT